MYLATLFYHKENVLVTAEDQIPLVEIHCCSTSITQDIIWFAKVNVKFLSDRFSNPGKSDFSVLVGPKTSADFHTSPDPIKHETQLMFVEIQKILQGLQTSEQHYEVK